MTATQTVCLNQTEYRVPPVIHAVQNDTGRKVKMVIQDQVLPSGSTATLEIFRSDKSHYSVTCETFVSADNSFTAEIDQALTQAGTTECQLKVSGIVSTFTFIIDVQPDVAGISVKQDGYSAEQIIEIMNSKGITEDIKQTLLACFAKVAWIDEDGQDYYDALYNALYPPRTLILISCVYMQSGTVYAGDSLDSLRPDLSVQANYEDGGSEVVTDYFLSGTLYEGESTITVTYGGKTTTFDVQVVTLVSISAVYTQTKTIYTIDTLDDLRDDLVVTATYDDSSTRTVTDYTLSGTLTEGTSTITVSYGGKTTTFTVEVDAYPYTFYDYVQGDGTAFIDTGLDKTYVTDTYKKYVKFKVDSSANEKAVFGLRNEWSTTGILVQINNSENPISVFFGNNIKTTTLSLGELTEIEMDYPYVKKDGTSFATVSGKTPTIIYDTATILLLSVWGGKRPQTGYYAYNGGWAAQISPFKIYQFTVTDKSTDTVIANMVPAKRNSDNAAGMYDTVRNTFYPNARDTGTLTLGNDE